MTLSLLAVVLDAELRTTITAAAAQAGFAVRLVGPGAELAAAGVGVDAVLVDLALPEAEGVTAALKGSHSAGQEVPFVAIARFLDAPDPGRVLAAGFTTVLIRPVAADRLAEVLLSLVPERRATEARPRILVVDDDVTNLKLAKIRLLAAGFDVVVVERAETAIAVARRMRPAAIVSDVLMPGLDGFGLCIAVRREPGLATTPVVLISANYVQEEDRVLAKKAGATAYLERKATLHELIDVLRDLLARGPQPVEIPRPEAIAALHLDRIRGQLDRQTRLNVALARRTAFDVATLAILDRTARIIAQAHGVQNALPQLLQGFVETGDLTLVVLYLADGPELRFQAAAGPTFIQAGTLPSGELCAEMLAAAPDGETVLLPGSTADVLRIREFLEATGVAHAILCPIHLWGERLGVLLLGSESRDLSGSGWRAFSRTVSTQLALALGLARAAIRTTP